MFTVGLRFSRADARRLRDLTARVQRGDMAGAAALFQSAATAARTGEPLILQCEDIVEATMMADGFVLYGVTRPAIEQLHLAAPRAPSPPRAV